MRDVPVARMLGVLAALCFASHSAAAQVRIQAGARLGARPVTQGIDSLAVLTPRGSDTVRVGTAVTETRLAGVAGHERILRVQRLLIGENPPVLADSFYLDRATSLPVSAHSRGDSGRDLWFDSTSVRIAPVRKGEPRTLPLGSRKFYQNSTDLLLAALPLAVGYSAVVPIFDDERPDAHLVITVTGRGTARTYDGGSCPALVVKVEGPTNTGIFRIHPDTRSWVGFESPHALLVRTRGC